jgi:hypothetical protein
MFAGELGRLQSGLRWSRVIGKKLICWQLPYGKIRPTLHLSPVPQKAGKPSQWSGVSVCMSNVEQEENRAAMHVLKSEICRLRDQQIAAEKIAGLVGMTPDEAERYRERHHRIRSLTSQLAVLDHAEEVAVHEQNETQAITRQSAEGAEADRPA